MAWDSTRPVPWQRLIREWLIYVAIMAVVLVVVLRNNDVFGAFAGLLVSGPLYLLFGFVLAKFGYHRKSLKEMREEPREPKKSKRGRNDKTAGVDASVPERSRPAPTSRTSGGGNRPKSKPRRR